VKPRAAADSAGMGGSALLSPFLFSADGDLQNQPKTQHRQLILVVFLCCFLDLLSGSSPESVPFGSAAMDFISFSSASDGAAG